MKGTYIAIEGIDGAGKSTYLSDIKKTLNGKHFLFVQEPAGENSPKICKDIQNIIYDNPDLTKEQLLMLFTIQRISLYNKVILPALEDGKVVISDRSIYSMLAYNVDGKDYVDYIFNCQEELNKLYKACPDFRLPELVLLSPSEDLRNKHMNKRGKTNWLDDSNTNHIRENYKFLSWYFRDKTSIISYDNDEDGYNKLYKNILNKLE